MKRKHPVNGIWSVRISILPFLAIITSSLIVLHASDGSGAAKAQSEAEEEDICIPEAIETEVLACPDGVEIKKFDKVTRLRPTATEKERVEKKKKGPTGPSIDRGYTHKITESSFGRKREKKKIDILKKELELLDRLAKSTADVDPGKADVLRRLADGYKNYFDQLNFMARELDEKIFLAKKKGEKKLTTKYIAQQKKLEEMARKSREKVIKAYVEIRNNFTDYPEYDEILFAIGYEIDQLALDIVEEEKKSTYKERARIFYNELIRNHPRSRFVPHAWMSYGEYYFFEAQNAEKARRSYEKVIEWGDKQNPNYVIATYFHAWCLFNLQRFQNAMQQFSRVIEYAKTNPDDPQAAGVAKRAKMEIVDAFSKVGNPSMAWEFFRRTAPDTAHRMFVKLSKIYFNEGRWADCIVVLHKLEALEIENYNNNNGDDICSYQHMVTKAVINSKPKEDQLKEMKRQLKLYKRFSQDRNHDPKKVKQCARDTIAMTWDQATHWHLEAVGTEEAPGTGHRATMEVTAKLYETILKAFPELDKLEIEGYDDETKPTRYRVAYYIADLYWAMKDWRKCGPAFDAVVTMDSSGELTTEAAYAAVLCYDKVYAKKWSEREKTRTHALKTSPTGKNKTCGPKCRECKKSCLSDGKQGCSNRCKTADREVLEPAELTDFDHGILRSYNRYVCFAKGGDDLVKIKYRRARIYYEANLFEQAAVLFKDIAVNHPKNEHGIYAANLYLDCLNALGDKIALPRPACYDNLAETVDVFIDVSKTPGSVLMRDNEFASQIKELKVGVMRKKAESLNLRKRFKQAAEIYLSVYRDYGGVYDDRGMCEVLFNTAINMEAARLVMPAIKVREKMIELYPDCEHSKKAAFYIGQNYHALQVFRLAAENYYDFAKRYPGEEEAPDALANAVMFYIGLGRYEQAWSAVRLYQRNYRAQRLDKTASVFFSAGYIYLNEAKGSKNVDKWEAVRSHYKSYLRNYSKAKLVDEQVQAHIFVGNSYWKQRPRDFDRAEKAYKKALSVFQKKAMQKVSNNKRKADMLNATASARYNIADWKYFEFNKILFPEFHPERDVPKRIQKWWDKKIGREEVARTAEVRKYRRLLVAWGEMDRKEARRETKKENANIQFEFWLEHRFKPWMKKKTKALDQANKLFADVVEMHVPEWEMAAAARAGDMQMSFMNALYDAPLPPAFRDDEELITIYRQSMDEKAQPFRDVAIKLFAHCLTVSTKIKWFNENSLRCEKELNKLDPGNYPVSEEIRVQPNNEIVHWAVPGFILEMESDAKKRDRVLETSAEELIGQENETEEQAVRDEKPKNLVKRTAKGSHKINFGF
ncbi:MAG: hypothetical protein GY847_35755 [Proteobacteria bacterium]|nr:hypothetical protein [Pseudomonadota bacterium]